MKKQPNLDFSHLDPLTSLGFRIHMLPAKHGDAFILKTAKGDKSGIIVVDGGASVDENNAFNSEILKYPEIDLMVLTHPDADHIDGILEYIKNHIHINPCPVKQIWANCQYEQCIQSSSNHSAIDAKKLSDILNPAIQNKKLVWKYDITTQSEINLDFADILILNPTPVSLKEFETKYRNQYLQDKYKKEPMDDSHLSHEEAFNTPLEKLAKNKKVPPPNNYNGAANFSSIAFLLNCDFFSILMLGDSFPDSICESLKAMGATKDNPLKVDFIKVAHHGSSDNISNEFLKLVECSNFLFSTNGGFGKAKHPTRETLGNILCHEDRDKSKTINLIFNYPLTVIDPKKKRLFNPKIDSYDLNYKIIIHHSPQSALYNDKHLATSKPMNPEIYFSPNYEDLMWNCVRLSWDGNLIGSGVLFFENDEFKVLTAAHCLRDANQQKIPANEISLYMSGMKDFPKEKELKIRQILYYNPDDSSDIAILSIDPDYPHYELLKNWKRMKFVGNEIFSPHNTLSTFVFRFCSPEGELFHLNKVEANQIEINGFAQAGNNPNDLDGISGGGVFTIQNGLLYCLGIFKRHFLGRGQMPYVETRPIPQLMSSELWIPKLDRSVFIDGFLATSGNHLMIEYNQAWAKLYDYLHKGIDNENVFSELIKNLSRLKTNYPLPWKVYHQQNIERMILDRMSDRKWKTPRGLLPKPESWLTEHEIQALALAWDDLGLWPGIYNFPHEMFEFLGNREEFRKLNQRAVTIMNYENDGGYPIDENTPVGQYEMIMRSAFRFDFREMKERVEQWSLSDADLRFLPKKVMLDSLWKGKSHLQQLGELIKADKDNIASQRLDALNFGFEEHMVATTIYNGIKPDASMESLSYEFLNKLGVRSPADYVQEMSKNVRKVGQLSEIYPYGVTTNSIIKNQSEKSFPSALRLLNYLIDTGLPTHLGLSNVVSTTIWHKIFLQLFHNFPFANVYYTLFYFSPVAKRCAQEIAFTDNPFIVAERQELLLKLLQAVSIDETPKIFLSQIWTFIFELIRCVDESIWMPQMKEILEDSNKQFGINFSGITFTDKGYELLSIIASQIHDSENVTFYLNWIFQWDEIDDYKKGKLISFINAEAMVAKAEKHLYMIQENTSSWPLYAVLPIIEIFYNYSVFSGLAKELLEFHINREGLRTFDSRPDLLIRLSLVVEDEKLLSEIKSKYLSQDLWNTGIHGNLFEYGKPFYGLSGLNPAIQFDIDDLYYIIFCLDRNLCILESYIESHPPFLDNSSLKLISILLDMKYFLLRYEGEIFAKGLIEKVNVSLVKITGSDSISLLLHSRNLKDLTIGLDILRMFIEKEGIDKYAREISLILSRILLKIEIGIMECVEFITDLIEKFGQEKLNQFWVDIKNVIRRVSELDYEEFNFDAINMRAMLERLHNIVTH